MANVEHMELTVGFDYVLIVRVRARPSAEVMIFGADCASLGRSVRSSPARTGDA
jgi:hypothetical protein